jgi:small subunit ribosomal protein S21
MQAVARAARGLAAAAVARAARGLAAAAAAARPSVMEAGHSGQVQQARGIVVQVRDGNLEPALSIMERKMRSSGTERLIRAHTLLDIKDSENRLLALKELMQRVRSQELMLRKIVIKQIRSGPPSHHHYCTC